MNILYINHTNTISGAGISFSTLLKHLPPIVEKYFCLHRKSQLAELFGAEPWRTYRDCFASQSHTTVYGEGMGWRLSCFHAAKAPVSFVTLALLKRKWKPDVVHLNETVLVPYAVSASLLGLPLLIHARTPVRPECLGMRLLSWVASRGRCKFASIDKETHDSLPPKCREASTIVPNPVEMRLATGEEIMAKRKEWDVPPDAVLVGQMASLHKEKGIWRILEIAKDICQKNPKIHFVLGGDPSPNVSEGPEFAQAIREQGLEKRVLLVGYQRDLPAAYGALDMVLCLFGEYLRAVGRTAYEAPLAGRPLIATLPDPLKSTSLVHGVTGLGFEPTDYAGVAAAILELAENPDARAKLGQSARNAICDRHDPDRHARRICEIYAELAGQPACGTSARDEIRG